MGFYNSKLNQNRKTEERGDLFLFPLSHTLFKIFQPHLLQLYRQYLIEAL